MYLLLLEHAQLVMDEKSLSLKDTVQLHAPALFIHWICIHSVGDSIIEYIQELDFERSEHYLKDHTVQDTSSVRDHSVGWEYTLS